MRIQDITPQSIEKIKDVELENLWKQLSLIWEVENVNKEDFINRAIFIINEYKRRGKKIEETGLYKAAFEWKSQQEQYATVYPSGEKLGREITLDEVTKFYKDPIKLMDHAISLVGGVVVHGKTENDFEALVRIPPREELMRRIQFRLDRAIPDISLRSRQHMLDDLHGPFTDFLPLYDLVLVPCDKAEKQQMAIEEQEVRAKSPESKRTAEKAERDNKITLGEFFYPLKSSAPFIAGKREGNKYDTGLMVHLLKKLGTEDNQAIKPVLIQKKYDGIHTQIHKKDGAVKIYSDDGTDITNRLPSIAKEIAAIKKDNFILDGELEMWDPDHRPREEMSAYLHMKGDPDDSSLILNIFDLLYQDKDIHEKPYFERVSALEEFYGFKQSTIGKPDFEKGQLNLSPSFKVTSEQDLRSTLSRVAMSPSSEGAMVKISDFKYALGGLTRDIIKLKTYATANGIVWKVNTTKVPTVFNYDYAFSIPDGMKAAPASIVEVGGKKYSNGGRSYDTAVKAQVGDIISIQFHSANSYKVRGDSGEASERVHLYEPIFGEKISKTTPDSVEEVKKKAQDAGILTTKTEGSPTVEEAEEIKEAVRQPFGSPGGKRYMADRLVRMIPDHKVYVETFIGGGAVFWKKKPSEKEVINDKDSDIVMAYRTIQNMTDEQWETLKKMNWRASKDGFARAKREIKSSTGLKRFHDFIYLKQFSDVAEMNSYDDRDDGKSWAGVNNLKRMRERLKNVTILNEDYASVIKKYDSKDTFFYIDPPYPRAALNWKWMPKTEEVESAVTGIKGKFLLSYELTKAFNKFNKWTIELWAIAHPGQHHKGMNKKEQLVSNYKVIKNTKYLREEDILSGHDWFNIFHEHFVDNGFAKDWLRLSEETKIRRITEALNQFEVKLGEGFRDEILQETRSRRFPTFEKVLELRLVEQDPYITYPPEDKPLRCVFQHHYRGKSVHADNRIETKPGGVLIGWTLNDQIPGEITKPVETLTEAKALDKQDKFKINWTNGQWKQRVKKGADKPVNVSIVCEKKAPEPHEWLSVEGVMKTGDVGATANFPGVFSILATGTAEYGAQKPYSHEYFFDAGKIDYKLVYRRLKLEFKEDLSSDFMKSVVANYLFDEDLEAKIAEAIANPSKVLAEIDLMKTCELFEAERIIPVGKLGLRPETGQVGWLAIKPIDQTPYVLSDEAVSKAWMPPLGISALPRHIRASIPAQYQYWKANSRETALSQRNSLVELIKKKEISIKEARHARNKCMECEAPPTYEVKWAEGMGHAWFCDKHFKSWSAAHKDDIDYVKRVKDGCAAERFADNPNPNIKEELTTLVEKFPITAPFTLQHQWWKGQVTIRFGPSTQHWNINVSLPDNEKLWKFVLEYNPLEEEEISFVFLHNYPKEWAKKGKPIERIEPGALGNPTKDTPSWIQMLDDGEVTVLEASDTFMKMEFKGNKLKGLWTAERESPTSEFWILKRSKAPQPK